MYFLVGNMQDGTYAVYQCKGRIGHDGGPIIAQHNDVGRATKIARLLNQAPIIHDLTGLPEFVIG